MRKLFFTLVLAIGLTACSNDDGISHGDIVVTDAEISNDSSDNVIFTSTIVNNRFGLETGDIEVWYNSGDVYFQYVISDVKLKLGENHIGGTIKEDAGVSYEISSITFTTSEGQYEIY